MSLTAWVIMWVAITVLGFTATLAMTITDYQGRNEFRSLLDWLHKRAESKRNHELAMEKIKLRMLEGPPSEGGK